MGFANQRSQAGLAGISSSELSPCDRAHVQDCLLFHSGQPSAIQGDGHHDSLLGRG
jgi:hypothetical protein